MSSNNEHEVFVEQMEALSTGDVVKVPELLEMVLLNLPIKDILVNAQRVCKKWNSVIADSPKLQQALFFAPVAKKPLHILQDRTKDKWTDDTSHNRPRPIVENPFYNRLTSLGLKTMEKTRGREAEFARKDASWCRMLTCQPHIDWAYVYLHDDNGSIVQVSNPAGLRFQDLEDVQLNRVSRWTVEILCTGFLRLPDVRGSSRWTSVEFAFELKKIASKTM